MVNWILAWVVMFMLIINIAIIGFNKFKGMWIPRWFIVLIIILSLILLASIIYVLVERYKCDWFCDNFIHTSPNDYDAANKNFELSRWKVKAHKLPYSWNFYSPQLEQLNYLIVEGLE